MGLKSRLIGQEVQIRISTKAGRLTTVTAVKSFSFEVDTAILTEGYLGEKFDRKDSVFKSVKGSFTVHPEDPEVFLFQQLIAQKAINRQFNEDLIVLTWKYSFPSGRVATFTVDAAEFASMPINSGGRDAYVEMPFSFEAEGYSLSV